MATPDLNRRSLSGVNLGTDSDVTGGFCQPCADGGYRTRAKRVDRDGVLFCETCWRWFLNRME